jgi:hypothetical protein
MPKSTYVDQIVRSLRISALSNRVIVDHRVGRRPTVPVPVTALAPVAAPVAALPMARR